MTDDRRSDESLCGQVAEPHEVAGEKVCKIGRGVELERTLVSRLVVRIRGFRIAVFAVAAGRAEAPTRIVDAAPGCKGHAGIHEPDVFGDVGAGP
jgi:hypothetical protein